MQGVEIVPSIPETITVLPGGLDYGVVKYSRDKAACQSFHCFFPSAPLLICLTER